MYDVADKLVRLAKDAAYQSDYDRAIYLCEQALERYPNQVAARELLAEYKSLQEFDEYFKLSKSVDGASSAEALAKIDAFLDLHPGRADALTLRAMYRETPQQTLEDLNRALDADPRSVEALHARANLYMFLDRTEDAERDIQAALNLDPNLPNTLVLRACINLEVGDVNGALKHLRRSLELDPDGPPAFAALAHACQQLGLFKRVLKYAARVKGTIYDDPDLALVEAEALIGLRRERKAQPILEGLHAMESRDPYATLLLAQVETHLERPGKVLELLKSCAEVFSDFGPWYILRGEVLLQTGRAGEALTELGAGLARCATARENGETMAVYNLAWCHAHRAWLAEKHSVQAIDVAAERREAMSLLAKAAAEDQACIRFATAERAFDPLHRDVQALTAKLSPENEPAI